MSTIQWSSTQRSITDLVVSVQNSCFEPVLFQLHSPFRPSDRGLLLECWLRFKKLLIEQNVHKSKAGIQARKTMRHFVLSILNDYRAQLKDLESVAD